MPVENRGLFALEDLGDSHGIGDQRLGDSILDHWSWQRAVGTQSSENFASGSSRFTT